MFFPTFQMIINSKKTYKFYCLHQNRSYWSGLPQPQDRENLFTPSISLFILGYHDFTEIIIKSNNYQMQKLPPTKILNVCKVGKIFPQRFLILGTGVIFIIFIFLGSVQLHKNQRLLVNENLDFQSFVLSFDALLERRKNFNEKESKYFTEFINYVAEHSENGCLICEDCEICEEIICEEKICEEKVCEQKISDKIISEENFSEEPSFTIREKARKFLVADRATTAKSEEKFINMPASISTIPQKCASNPEINVYIRKPKFSRDTFDYDVAREGYTARKLVCDEKSESHPLIQTIYWIDDCDDVPEFNTVVTVVVTSDKMLDPNSRYLTEVNILSIPTVYETKDSILIPPAFNNVTLVDKLEYDSISTPYILLLHNNFDFNREDANLHRMIRAGVGIFRSDQLDSGESN